MLRNGTHYLYGVMSIKPHDDNQNIRLFTDVLSPAHRDWIIMMIGLSKLLKCFIKWLWLD